MKLKKHIFEFYYMLAVTKKILIFFNLKIKNAKKYRLEEIKS